MFSRKALPGERACIKTRAPSTETQQTHTPFRTHRGLEAHKTWHIFPSGSSYRPTPFVIISLSCTEDGPCFIAIDTALSRLNVNIAPRHTHGDQGVSDLHTEDRETRTLPCPMHQGLPGKSLSTDFLALAGALSSSRSQHQRRAEGLRIARHEDASCVWRCWQTPRNALLHYR